jgi:beta-galactosidase
MKTKAFGLALLVGLLSLHARAQLPPPAGGALRQVIRLDEGWKFHRGGAQSAEEPAFDDSRWRSVDLPHDWSIEDLPASASPFDRDAVGQVSTGFTTGGTGWYRKTFQAPGLQGGRRVVIQFDGAYMNAEVWVNGRRAGSHPYGYSSFWFDITDRLKAGEENLVAVKVRNEGENSRWYSGSGLYRHVWLKVVAPVHVVQWGTSVTTSDISTAAARVAVRTSVENQATSGATGSLATRILAPGGHEVGRAESSFTLAPGQVSDVAHDVAVTNPTLWSIESPALYTAVSEVRVAGQFVDRVDTPFGIRSVAFEASRGFLLNGQPMKLKGGCFHHDHGPLGARSYDRAEERRVELLKASGFNAIRCSHNPPAPALLDAADRLGLLVIDEAFDMWADPKNPHDYSLFFERWWQEDLAGMIARDRNHPSVIAWSIGNEIPGMDEPRVVETAKTLAAFVRKTDPTRPVLAAVNNLGPKKDPFFAALDIAGYNYGSGGDHEKAAIFDTDHERVPSRVMIQTESYPLEAFRSWMDVLDHPWLLGDFVWTAFDYLGEASIGWRGYWQEQGFYPWNLAFCGDIDICGWKRPQSYYRDALWKENQLSIFVTPPTPSFEENPNRQPWSKWHWLDAVADWNWKGHENRPIRVTVYSSCEEAELFLDGASLGRKKTDRSTEFKAAWEVPYRPGELKALGYRGGKQVRSASLKTAGEASHIVVIADRDRITADGQDLSYITVELRDAGGTRNPKAENALAFRLQGPGTIAGVGNANPVSIESYQRPERKAWQGRALVIVRSANQPGDIRLEVSSPGLPPAAITIRSVSPPGAASAQARPAPLPDMYRSVHALTWVVRDVDKAIAGWRKLGFEDIRSRGVVTLTDVRYRGKPARCTAKLAEGYLGDVAVQWVQPVEGENAYTDFVARHGDGVFSLVHRAPTREVLRAEVERMKALGVGILQSETVPGDRGMASRTYLDTEPEGKYVLGLVHDPEAAAPGSAPPGRKVVQYAFAVRRLEPVLAYWSRLGFDDRSVTHPPLWDLRYHDQPGTFDAELGWQRHGRVPYEWILPLQGPTVYRDHMDTHGEGFHHIAFEVADLDEEVARWNALGFPFVQGGAWGEKGKPGWGRFAYQDTQAIGGADVELLWNYRDGK